MKPLIDKLKTKEGREKHARVLSILHDTLQDCECAICTVNAAFAVLNAKDIEIDVLRREIARLWEDLDYYKKAW